MPSLWFCVPAFGRVELARICLAQLRLTCDALTENGVEASAVVVADDENIDTALSFGFGAVRRDNRFVSRRFNDAIQLACDPRHNPRPADYVVPFGSDDWADWRLFLNLPGPDEMVAFRMAAFVSEDGRSIAARTIDTRAGVGIRIYPRQMMARCGYRPADEDRERFCDMSMLVNVTRTYSGDGPTIVYGDLHEFQIVDWKTAGTQLNGYEDMVRRHRNGPEPTDPFDALDGIYPQESLEAMRAHYGVRERVAA